jgi:renalase
VKKSGPVAIIGAGLSGLSCAQALQAAGVTVHIYEQSSSIGGRCATQLWQGHLVDLGVQYFTAQTPEFKKELLTRLRQFRPIVAPILDPNNQIVVDATGPRFYVLQGNNYFAHVLSLGLDIRLNTLVEALKFLPDGIECQGETYQAVISSLPGSLSQRLFGLSQPPAEFAPCLVALLEYMGGDIGHTRECYGRIVPSGKEIIRASYCENNKVGRIVGNKTVFVVEAGANFSREFVNAPSDAYLPMLASRHEELWGITMGHLTASYGHAWHYARSVHPTTPSTVQLPTGAFICGDSRSESTVEKVWIDGNQAAKEVLAYLEIPAV